MQAEQLFAVPDDWWKLRRCRVCRGALNGVWPAHRTEPVYTYVMARQWWWKIGKSYQPETRRKVLSMPSPGCRVVAPTGMDWSEPIAGLLLLAGDVEHALHERWADRHEAGEWFLPDEAMRDWLQLTAREAVPWC